MSLSAAEQIEYAELLERQVAAETFTDYIARVSPKYAAIPRHLKPLVRLVQATRRRQVFATVSQPPRGGKTTTLVHGLAWRVGLDPACLNFYVTYGEALAKPVSRKVRKLARASITLAKDAQGVHEWETEQGGGLKATSVGGPITGRGCNGGLIVADDLIKGRKQAESKLYRDTAWDYFRDDMMSRLETGASLIVPATRWHEDDIIGRLMRDPLGQEWTHINIPAVADADGNAVDERVHPAPIPYWPEGGYDLPALAKIRARGEYGWWSLFQGMPRPKGARLFEEPSRFELAKFTWEGKRGCIGIDPAATEKTTADWSAAVVCAMAGYGDQSEMWILHVERWQKTIPTVCRHLRALQKRYGLYLAVEAVGGFKAVPQTLRDTDPHLRLVEIYPTLDKFTRAQPMSAAWNGTPTTPQRVHVPIDAPWADVFISEMKLFTGVDDDEDDQVDAAVHGWNTLYREKPAAQRSGSRVGDYLPFG